MPAPNPYTIFTADYNQDLARTGAWVASTTTDPTTLAPLMLKLVGITSSQEYKHAIGNRQVLTTAAATANPYDAADKVRLEFTDSAGNAQFLVLPGPKASIFLPDDETVDPADLDIIALVAQAIIDLKGRGGEDYVTYVSGRRIRRQRRAA